MIDMLPNSEQLFALEFVKRLVLAWDPDYTKVTPAEADTIQQAIDEYRRGEFVPAENIEWK
jgi:hypothetical protein